MLGKLFGGSKAKPAPEPAVPPLSSAVSASILNVVGAGSIPPMPSAAQRAFQLATDPNAEAQDFIEVIESDESLSARVLKIANSVYFDRGKQSTTIPESVLIIGINELRCLLNATTLSEIFPSKHAARAQFWANDIATGLIARALAQRLLPSKAETAFLGGLMHDIGKLLLLQRAPGEYQKVIDRVEREGCSFSEAEIDLFPFDHTEVGQLIAERWRFSPELIEVIRGHHAPINGGEERIAPSLARIVQLADACAHALGLAHPRGFHKVKARHEEIVDSLWRALGLPPAEKKESLARFLRSFESEYDLYSGRS